MNLVDMSACLGVRIAVIGIEYSMKRIIFKFHYLRREQTAQQTPQPYAVQLFTSITQLTQCSNPNIHNINFTITNYVSIITNFIITQ